jgi:hypothetical protein
MGLIRRKRYQHVRGIDSDCITDSGGVLEPPQDAPYTILDLAASQSKNHWTRAMSTFTPYAKVFGVPILYKARVDALARAIYGDRLRQTRGSDMHTATPA